MHDDSIMYLMFEMLFRLGEVCGNSKGTLKEIRAKPKEWVLKKRLGPSFTQVKRRMQESDLGITSVVSCITYLLVKMIEI